MDLGLKGQVALVTGASKGIGKNIAKALAAEGVRLVICSRRQVNLKTVQKELRVIGAKVEAITCDVTSISDVRKVMKFIDKKFGRLDILVNNAGGVDQFGNFMELNEDAWLQSFQTNVMSVVHCVRYALPLIRKSSRGKILNISSISGVEPGYYNSHYTAAKAAVINLTKSLANQLSQENILVNVICAGPVLSDLWDRNVKNLADKFNISFQEAKKRFDQEECAKIPLGRVGVGEDIAGLAVFLVSKQASWVTGSCFHVNGGKLRAMC